MRWFYLFTVLFLASCGPTPHFSELVELDNTKWTTEEVIVFSPLIEDLDSAYDLHLIIDHNQNYSYENIYFKIITKFPDQNSQEELLSVDLADNKGQWVGNCSGDDCKCKVYLLENFRFPSSGTYHFEIGQYSRDENLAGINSLELQLYFREEES